MVSSNEPELFDQGRREPEPSYTNNHWNGKARPIAKSSVDKL